MRQRAMGVFCIATCVCVCVSCGDRTASAIYEPNIKRSHIYARGTAYCNNNNTRVPRRRRPIDTIISAHTRHTHTHSHMDIECGDNRSGARLSKLDLVQPKTAAARRTRAFTVTSPPFLRSLSLCCVAHRVHMMLVRCVNAQKTWLNGKQSTRRAHALWK